MEHKVKLRFFLIMFGLGLAGSAAAQNAPGWDPAGLQLTREELQDMLTRWDSVATAPSISGTLRERARSEAGLIRRRLEEGDLNVGDRIELIVEGQPTLTNTFTVVAGRFIVLPDLSTTATQVPLHGVLRSELQQHMHEFISRYIRNPVVHARSLIRLEIMGAVGNPGFYTLPSDMIFSDALMAAGGVGATGDLEKIRIERDGEVIWEKEYVREAIRDGRTLDQLSVRAGDGIYVEQKSTTKFLSFRTILTVLSAASTVIFVGRRAGIF
ncbi:MAG TPA: SLBB domain-containing protein [Longimicrobiales bacterium]